MDVYTICAFYGKSSICGALFGRLWARKKRMTSHDVDDDSGRLFQIRRKLEKFKKSNFPYIVKGKLIYFIKWLKVSKNEKATQGLLSFLKWMAHHDDLYKKFIKNWGFCHGKKWFLRKIKCFVHFILGSLFYSSIKVFVDLYRLIAYIPLIESPSNKTCCHLGW